MDINKVSDNTIGQDDNNDKRPQINSIDSGLHKPVTNYCCDTHTENVGAKSVEEHY